MKTAAAVLAAVLAPLAAAGSTSVAWHTVGIWRQPHGLAQNTIRSMLQTRDGYLWLGTHGGLARFDGVRFTTFDDSNSPLRENEIWALIEARDGSLWIGTYGGGLSRLKDGRFEVFTTADGLVNDTVSALCEDREGAIWIGTDHGLSRYFHGRFTNYREGLAHHKIRALYTDTDGTVWIGTVNGSVNRLRDGKLQIEALVAVGASPSGEVRGFLRTRDGALWVATFDGLWRLKDGRVAHFTTADGLASNSVPALHEDPDGNLWIATDNGLNRYHDGRFFFHRIAYPLPVRQHLTTLMGDREGSLWVGSWSQGVAHVRRSQFLTWGSRDGLAGDYVSTVLQDPHGDVWVGTNKGLSVFRGEKLVTQPVPGESLNVTSMALDSRGRLLLGTPEGVHVAALDGKAPTTLLGNERRLYARVIHVDRRGVIWIGTDSAGLARYDGKLTMYTTPGRAGDAVRALTDDGSGGLWVGTRGGGLFRFADGVFHAATTKSGTLPKAAHALFVDEHGALWMATRQGISRLKDDQVKTLTTADGLFSSFVYGFLDDGRGHLWMTCSRGIFRVPKNDLNDRADGRRGPLTSVVYGLEHGLGGIVGTVGHAPSSCRTRDGRLWFATANGVAAADPEDFPRNEVPPPVYIEHLEADRRAVAVAPKVELPPGRGDLAFRYTGISLLAPDKVTFRHKLEGYDNDWQEAGTRREAQYTNIPPGPYRFHVQACNNDGLCNEEGAAIELRLRPHFYQKPWFLAACLLGIVLGSVGVHNVRVRTMAAQQVRLETLVGERTRELSEATKMLDLANRDLEKRVADGIEALREAERLAAYGQLVAAVAHEVRHPIFALQAATHVLRDRVGDQASVQPQFRTLESETNRLNVLMSDLLDFARPPELHRAPATATELFAEAADVFGSEEHPGVKVKVEVQPDLPTLDVDRFRLVQALLNLMRNAVSHAAGLTCITLCAQRYVMDSTFVVRLSVSDDGAGIRPELLSKVFEPFVTSGKGTGLGLSIARRVATAHGGQVSVESERGQGTVFHIDLPVA